MRACLLMLLAVSLLGQGPQRIAILVNQVSARSRSIAEYYALRRGIPLDHICRLTMPLAEEITRQEYDRQIARPLATWLRSARLAEQVYYLVTTTGVPLKIRGSDGLTGDRAAVDSELALLYLDMTRGGHSLPGPLANPYFHSGASFRHPDFPIYLVTRLTGYSFADVKGLIDRALAARNRGKFVIDLKADDYAQGNDWLRDAAQELPAARVVLDTTTNVLANQRDVIGYASWGSNDPHRKARLPGFEWLPGAIVTEFVSTDARSFAAPPPNWTLGTWLDKTTWFAGSPQSMTGDYLHEGATGASGHVYEPFLQFTPRPDYLLPAYYAGRNLAESFYLALPALSWQNVVIGDPLCAIGRPGATRTAP